MRNEVVGNFKGGEKQKTPAIELLKPRVEAWILARKNHIHLDKVRSTIGSQNGNYHSFSLLFFFCYLVLIHLWNELIRKKAYQSETIVFTVSYTLRRDQKNGSYSYIQEKLIYWNCFGGPVVKSPRFKLRVVWVRYLLWELGSHMLCSTA